MESTLNRPLAAVAGASATLAAAPPVPGTKPA